MMGFDASTTTVLAAAGATTVVAAGVFLAYKSSRSVKKTTKKGQKSKEVSRDQLVAIFTEICKHMQITIENIKQQVLQILHSQQGGGITEEDIYGYMSKTLQEKMAAIEQRTYAKHGVTLKDVKKASAIHKDDPDFKKIVERMKGLNASCKKSKVETPKDFTEEKCIALLREMIASLKEVLEETVKEITTANPSIRKPIPGALVLPRVQLKQQAIITSLCGKYGIKADNFDAAISTFKESEEVAACVNEMYLLPGQYGIAQQ